MPEIVDKPPRRKQTWYKHNKEYFRKYRLNNIEKIRETNRKWNFSKHFGMTIQDYNVMFENQGGRCAICKTHHSSLPRALNVDHCHKTGKVRGLLCDGCNVGLGRFNDKEDVLLEAVNYLRQHTT